MDVMDTMEHNETNSPQSAKSMRKTIVIVGGGVTGLSAAYYLEKFTDEQGLPLRIVLAEATNRLGGKISTETFDGFVIEKGPDSFLARKVAALDLIRDIGIEGELVGTNPSARKTYILHQGTLHRIPAGLNLGVPTQFNPFVKSGLLSLRGKLRAGLDFILPRSADRGDRSLGDFLERRLGKEVVDFMAEPILAGIYAGDLRKLSLRATFPQFEQYERDHGSLVLGMLAQGRISKTPQAGAAISGDSTTSKEDVHSIPQSAFLSLRGGLKRIIEQLRASLRATSVHLSAPVRSIADRTPDGHYVVHIDAMEPVLADVVGVAVENYSAAALLPERFAGRAILENVPYVSVATVILAYQSADLGRVLDGSGFVVPRKEGRTITACTWVSSKWLHTAPPGRILIRCYVGRSGQEEIVEQSDEEIIHRVRSDVADIMGVTAPPRFSRVTRWRRAMPQYTVGHLDRVATFHDEAEKAYPGLLFAGAGFTGLGIPDCIAQGKQLAARMMERLNPS